MLVLAGTTKEDIVFDLGCGDGRIPIAAAKTFGARGVGIDIDPRRIQESRQNAVAAGVEHLVEFRLGDALAADVSPATIVTLYMLGSGNAALRPLLTRQLRPGARIVSHAFSMGPTWPADKIDQFVSARGDEVTLYFWRADGTDQAVTGDQPRRSAAVSGEREIGDFPDELRVVAAGLPGRHGELSL